jgi:CMP-N-acetylneuraminic acid synthetase
MDATQANAIAIIPARGGSKGIPRKNIKVIAGKPLIAWTIEAAKGCPYIAQVVVTSDDDEILSVAREYGADTIMRPTELASDTAGAKPVLAHALTHVKEAQGTLPRYVVYLQPTSPLRNSTHLTEAFATLLADPHADALISVCEIDNTVLKASLTDADGYLVSSSRPEFANMNRQMLPKLYKPNGAIYVMQTKELVESPRFDGERTLPFVMSEEDSADLDSPEDIPPVEALLKKHIV